jgi:hypothetical protein
MTLIDKEFHKSIRASGLLLAILTILAPIACGRQCVYSAANLAFDAMPTSGAYSDLVQMSHDNISGSMQNGNCYGAGSNASPLCGGVMASAKEENSNCEPDPAALENDPGEPSNVQPSERSPAAKAHDFNQDIYYKNKLEFALDGGWLPINIPLPFDVFSGDSYNTYPLKYTLVPIIASLRWHMNDIAAPWALRGNWDFQFSASITAIPRGPETRYFVYMMGMRRNFVPRNWRAAPYFDVRVGMGHIDAQGPVGVYYAQGQDLTFNFNFGSGVRYNFNSRYAISAGVNYMHISNANLSQGWGVTNYGINVLGPMVGIDVQFRRHRRHSE